jgi:aspartate racemase
MRTIGLLGGMSWESTAVYYRLLNEGVRDRLGGLSSARVLLHSVDFAEVAALQRADRWDDAGRLLAAAARGLEGAGADLVLIGTNTMHAVAPQVRAALGVPLLHLVDVTAAAVAAAGLGRVGLLGTAFTMAAPWYREPFTAAGVELVVPPDDDRALVHRVIFDELCVGVVSDASRAALRTVLDGLVAEGAQGAVLGCTELELLLGPDDAAVPLFPTTRLHVEAALDAALAAG